MKVSFVARNAFEAYLISSEVVASVMTDRRARVAEQLGDPGGRLAVVRADDDAVGLERVGDRGALAQELGVRDDDDVGAADDALDEADRADRHRRLVHDDRAVGEVRRDLRRRLR